MTCFPLHRHFLLAFAMLLAGALVLNAQTTAPASDVPRTISYQGILSSDGKAYADGEYDITVTLYGDRHGTNHVWQYTYTTRVIGGVFNLYLGEGRPLPDLSKMNMPLWIGTSVNGAEEMRPLTPLSASPYALNVPDRAITTTKIADGAVTAEKVDLDYISEVQIEGEKISAKGTVLNLVGTPSVPLSFDEETQSVTIGRVPAQTGDNEKEAGILAGTANVWSVNGDGWDATLGSSYTPAAGDWLGTSNAVDLLIKVNGQRTMLYQQTGAFTTPNIIGGAASNSITNSTASIIGGGGSNTIDEGIYNVIGGGEGNSLTNLIYNDYNTIGGGEANSTEDGEHNAIGGGYGNSIEKGRMNVIGGGENNAMFPPSPGERINWATIGGGEGNVISGGVWGTIGGGFGNTVTGGYGAIGGGQGNQVGQMSSTIAGGQDNIINDCFDLCFIGGGLSNLISGGRSAIGGGEDNTIPVSATHAFIGSGRNNLAGAYYSAIAGGDGNNISTSAMHASIGGGEANTAGGSHTTIPGGDNLLTNASYAQSAMGFFNAPRGMVANRPVPGGLTDDPLFMIGNGDYNVGNPVRSNAFEVSYNGHSVVYDANGNTNGGGRIPIEGGTYTDNITYAWGDIAAGGAINSDFGVVNVANAPVGTYTITINVQDPLGNPVTLNNGSVTATVIDNFGSHGCTSISVSQLGIPGPNQFMVRTYQGLDCQPTDLPFTFKVTGRP